MSDFVFCLVRFDKNGSDWFMVKKQIAYLQGDELTDPESCIEHQQGHAVVADRLAGFVGCAGVVR